jgi:hypothetical protein
VNKVQLPPLIQRRELALLKVPYSMFAFSAMVYNFLVVEKYESHFPTRLSAKAIRLYVQVL